MHVPGADSQFAHTFTILDEATRLTDCGFFPPGTEKRPAPRIHQKPADGTRLENTTNRASNANGIGEKLTQRRQQEDTLLQRPTRKSVVFYCVFTPLREILFPQGLRTHFSAKLAQSRFLLFR